MNDINNACEALWTEAFYDRAYGRDQTRRLIIIKSVVEFLIRIGCHVKWNACHDGSDIDPEYGIYISGITYEGTEYEHNPCYQIRYELPPKLLEKMDREFDARIQTMWNLS